MADVMFSWVQIAYSIHVKETKEPEGGVSGNDDLHLNSTGTHRGKAELVQ